MTPEECMLVAIALARAGERDLAETIAMSVLAWVEKGRGHASVQAVRVAFENSDFYWEAFDQRVSCTLIEPSSEYGHGYAVVCGVQVTHEDGRFRSLVDILTEIEEAEVDWSIGLRRSPHYGEASRMLRAIRGEEPYAIDADRVTD